MGRLVSLYLCLFCLPLAYASPTKELVQRIEILRQKMHIPGASVAVIDKGKIAWKKGFGFADLSHQRKITTQTLFQAASITKTLTAAATLKLLSEKGIAFDEPVNRYLKQWQIPTNQYSKTVPVSFRLLLNHTAAISNPYPDGGYGPKDKLPTLLEVYTGKKPATNPPLTVTQVPGRQFSYCNGCYAVLQGALEAIANKTYPALMQSLVLTPAAMSESRFDNNLAMTNPEAIALPYAPNLTPYANAPTRNPIYATGLLWTTAGDLAKFSLKMAEALKHSNDLITQSLATDLVTPSVSPTHGLGFFIGDKRGNEKACGRYIFHSGSNIGYLSLSIINKNGQQGAAILINISPKWEAKDYPQFKFIQQVIKLLGTHYQWA